MKIKILKFLEKHKDTIEDVLTAINWQNEAFKQFIVSRQSKEDEKK